MAHKQIQNAKEINLAKKDVKRALSWLTKLGALWIIVALIGQWIFALYIGVSFGLPILSGNADQSTFSHMIKGYVDGDNSGNYMLYLHLIPAGLISLCGIFQFLPLIRKKFPLFHRFNGRLFLSLGLIGAFTGLYLTWVRDSRLSDFGALGITLNGLLIPIAVFFAWKYALNKRFDLHQRFAIHSFMLINGVWTFRLYLMAWFMINQGPAGNSPNIDGPADIFFSYACYLLPMLFTELYLWAQKQKSVIKIHSVNFAMLLGIFITALGVFSSAIMMWIPRIY